MHDSYRTQRDLEEALQETEPETFDFAGEDGAYPPGALETDPEAALYEDTSHESAYNAGLAEDGYEEPAYEAPYQRTYETAYEQGPYETPAYEAPSAPAYEDGAFESVGYEAVVPEDTMATEDAFEEGMYETPVEEAPSYESPLSEDDEIQLASEFLEITNEDELDYFLGKLIRRVGRGIRRLAPVGRALGGLLKPLARAALPLAGRVVGGFAGGPLGAAVGGKLAGAATGLFEIEPEGLSPEDRDYEVARRFVRLSAGAVRHAAVAPRHLPPTVVARRAVAASARTVAPGAVRAPGPRYPPRGVGVGPGPVLPSVGGRRRGIWVRRGRNILIMGA